MGKQRGGFERGARGGGNPPTKELSGWGRTSLSSITIRGPWGKKTGKKRLKV